MAANDVQDFIARHGGKAVRLPGTQGGSPTFVCPDGCSTTCGLGMNTYLEPPEPTRRLRYQREYYSVLREECEVQSRMLDIALKDKRAKPWQFPQPGMWFRNFLGEPYENGKLVPGETLLARMRVIVADCDQQLQRVNEQLAQLSPHRPDLAEQSFIPIL